VEVGHTLPNSAFVWIISFLNTGLAQKYKKLKESGAKVSFYDINNKINEILENAGVQISPK